MSENQERLRARLRNAERRLAEAEGAQINLASSTFGGHAGGPGDAIAQTAALNRRIAEATEVDALRDEIDRLRAELDEAG